MPADYNSGDDTSGMVSVNVSDCDRYPYMTRRVMRGFEPARLVRARELRGISPAELARLANVGTSTLYAWEAGRATPQIDLLARVMAVLATPIDQVVVIDPDQRFPGDWRVMQGLTQPQLAAAVRIPTSTLRAIESTEIALTDANATTLAGALDITSAEYRAAYDRARQRPAGTPA